MNDMLHPSHKQQSRICFFSTVASVSLIALLSFCPSSNASEPILSYNFNNGSGVNATNNGSLKTPAALYGADNRPDNLFTPDGEGISGKSGDFALAIPADQMGAGNDGRPAGYALVTPLELSGTKSFTISGWFRAKSTPRNNSRLVEFNNGKDSFVIFFIGTGVLRIEANGKVLGDSSLYNSTNEWTYWAISYDATTSTDNLTFYMGTRDITPDMMVSETFTAPQIDLTEKTAGKFFIGNNGSRRRPFYGTLDNVVLITSKIDASGALSRSEIETQFSDAVK